jgi:hypothetical protein
VYKNIKFRFIYCREKKIQKGIMNQNLFIIFILTILSYLIEYLFIKRKFKDRLIDYFIIRLIIITLCYNSCIYLYKEINDINDIQNITEINNFIKKIQFSDIIDIKDDSFEYKFYIGLLILSILISIKEIINKINKYLDYYRDKETKQIKEINFIEIQKTK